MRWLLFAVWFPTVLHALVRVSIIGRKNIDPSGPVNIQIKFHNDGDTVVTLPRSLAPYSGKMFSALFKITCNGEPAIYKEGEGKIRSSMITLDPGQDYISEVVDLTKLYDFPQTACTVKYMATGVWKRAPFNLESDEQEIQVDPSVVAASAGNVRAIIASSGGDDRIPDGATIDTFANCSVDQQAKLKVQIQYARAMADEAYEHLKCSCPNGNCFGGFIPHVCLRFIKWFGVKSAFRKQEACQILGWLRTAIKNGILFDCHHPYCIPANEKYAVPSFIRRLDVDKVNVCEQFWLDPGAETGAPVLPMDIGINDTQAGDLLNAFLRFYTGIELRDLAFGVESSAEMAALYSLNLDNDAALLNTDNLQYYIENPGLLP